MDRGAGPARIAGQRPQTSAACVGSSSVASLPTKYAEAGIGVGAIGVGSPHGGGGSSTLDRIGTTLTSGADVGPAPVCGSESTATLARLRRDRRPDRDQVVALRCPTALRRGDIAETYERYLNARELRQVSCPPQLSDDLRRCCLEHAGLLELKPACHLLSRITMCRDC